jgi:biopolymer transport protein ExbB
MNAGLTQILAAAAPDAVSVTSIWDFVVKGGIVMIPIGLCSLATVTIAVERAISLRRAAVMPPALLDELRQRGAAGDLAGAAAACARHPSSLGRIVAAGLRRRSGGPETVRKAIEEAGQREMFALRKYLRVFTLIVALAPLLGLLGTIFGMIKAFQTVALSADALGRTELLAGGIYEAMITTAAGLIVAIPALLLYHWFAARIDRLVLDMDAVCGDLIEGREEAPAEPEAGPAAAFVSAA